MRTHTSQIVVRITVALKNTRLICPRFVINILVAMERSHGGSYNCFNDRLKMKLQFKNNYPSVK